MDSIIMLLCERMKEFHCIKNYIKSENGCEIITNEGIYYNIYVGIAKHIRDYYLCNDNYKKRCRINIEALQSKYENFTRDIIVQIFENRILKNEIMYKAFKEGVQSLYEERDYNDISQILLNEKYIKFSKDNELDELVHHIFDRGYEFAKLLPDPDLVYKQYKFLKKKVIDSISLETITDCLLRNKKIHINFEEKNIYKESDGLENVKEFEYSNGHIKVKADKYNIQMSILPLRGEILVVEPNGGNQILKCNIPYYPIEYVKKSVSEMFKSLNKYELDNYMKYENFIKKEIIENE